ncbi:hypothetical protein EES41_39645 (plasmid) [Streptomyces sp. ADI95-16]|uniref:DUF6415 family natural product biosynthesis protein n=1 Tax=Streptomyces sp. ADI95-16 TaxID=1522758 RepID=UPI000F3A848C|nr:DUF6415 family natural product biosynthesis protein [Streptomyces sp. ADI95-16]AYV32889.1 hypothetical protein EES41_39645 [Streptomyces sp. ADI95-16]
MTPLAGQIPEAVPAAPWTPPLPARDLRRLASHLRTGVSVDDLFQIIEEVQEQGHALKEPDVLSKTERLRGALMQLVDAVLERDGDLSDEPVKTLVNRARTLRQEEPTGRINSLAYLRRLAIVTEALMEALLAGMPEVPE